MENGNVVEQGTHDALIAKHGAYWRLDRFQVPLKSHLCSNSFQPDS